MRSKHFHGLFMLNFSWKYILQTKDFDSHTALASFPGLHTAFVGTRLILHSVNHSTSLIFRTGWPPSHWIPGLSVPTCSYEYRINLLLIVLNYLLAI